MKKINFTLKELVDSDMAYDYGIDNTPKSMAVYQSLMNLIWYILQPLRDGVGFPIIISSGYRCEKLNDLVNGVPKSNHLFGLAADIDCGRDKNYIVYDWLNAHQDELPIDELLWEENGEWIHVSLDPLGIVGP